MSTAPEAFQPIRERVRRETEKTAPATVAASRTMHPRYLEAHAAAWLRALRNETRLQP